MPLNKLHTLFRKILFQILLEIIFPFYKIQCINGNCWVKPGKRPVFKLTVNKTLHNSETGRKFFKMSPFQLQKLPNEIILKVFAYLETKDLIQYGHVSKRIRDICHDESLWKKINLYDKVIYFRGIVNKTCH